MVSMVVTLMVVTQVMRGIEYPAQVGPVGSHLPHHLFHPQNRPPHSLSIWPPPPAGYQPVTVSPESSTARVRSSGWRMRRGHLQNSDRRLRKMMTMTLAMTLSLTMTRWTATRCPSAPSEIPTPGRIRLMHQMMHQIQEVSVTRKYGGRGTGCPEERRECEADHLSLLLSRWWNGWMPCWPTAGVE